jgi:hypothetical protein
VTTDGLALRLLRPLSLDREDPAWDVATSHAVRIYGDREASHYEESGCRTGSRKQPHRPTPPSIPGSTPEPLLWTGRQATVRPGRALKAVGEPPIMRSRMQRSRSAADRRGPRRSDTSPAARS